MGRNTEREEKKIEIERIDFENFAKLSVFRVHFKRKKKMNRTSSVLIVEETKSGLKKGEGRGEVRKRFEKWKGGGK